MSAEPRLHATLVSMAKVMHCIQCSVVTFCLFDEHKFVVVTHLSVAVTGFYMDGRAALDYLFSRSDICHQKVIVFGRSLGGAVALRVCSESYYAARVAAVIVENTFTSISDLARAMFDLRILHYLPEWCYKNKVCRCRKTSCHSVMIH